VTGGFTWTHWIAANIRRNELKDNESQIAGLVYKEISNQKSFLAIMVV
jgi:phosphatidylethanolamine-binding protein (PEBP) family uncharacterized protein